jgi:hypothetical protein
MKTLGPRTRISPVLASMRTSFHGAAMPMQPGRMRSIGV